MWKPLVCLTFFVLIICNPNWAQENSEPPKISKKDFDLDDIAHQFKLIEIWPSFSNYNLNFWLKLELKEGVDTSQLLCKVVLFDGKEAIDSFPLKFDVECPLRKGERVGASFSGFYGRPLEPGLRFVIRRISDSKKKTQGRLIRKDENNAPGLRRDRCNPLKEKDHDPKPQRNNHFQPI